MLYIYWAHTYACACITVFASPVPCIYDAEIAKHADKIVLFTVIYMHTMDKHFFYTYKLYSWYMYM